MEENEQPVTPSSSKSKTDNQDVSISLTSSSSYIMRMEPTFVDDDRNSSSSEGSHRDEFQVTYFCGRDGTKSDGDGTYVSASALSNLHNKKSENADELGNDRENMSENSTIYDDYHDIKVEPEDDENGCDSIMPSSSNTKKKQHTPSKSNIQCEFSIDIAVCAGRNVRKIKSSAGQNCKFSTRNRSGIVSKQQEVETCEASNAGEVIDEDGILGGEEDNHVASQAEDTPYQCSICEKVFSQTLQLIAHMKLHTGEKPFECSECGKTYRRKVYLRTHMRIHTGENLHPCPTCGKEFVQRRLLLSHMKSHSEEKPYVCSVCEKSFRQKYCLDSHMRSHSQARPYECSICQKTYRLSDHLKTHMRVHTGERPFQCSICEKAFRRTEHLTSHMKVHSQEKPFHCSLCEKSFKHSHYLKEHIRIHLGEKTHTCSICDKVFGRSQYLERHMLSVHTDKKPHECSLCEKAFSQSYQLKKHMEIHESKTPAAISECEEQL